MKTARHILKSINTNKQCTSNAVVTRKEKDNKQQPQNIRERTNVRLPVDNTERKLIFKKTQEFILATQVQFYFVISS